MRYSPRLLALVAAVLLSPLAQAGVANDIPSCYAANKMKLAPPATETEVFVLIDQTTPLDASLQNSVRENAGRLIKAGSSFVIASFSSFGQGRYLEVLSAGTLEGGIDPKLRDDISVKLLRNFDACMAGQADFGRNAAAAALNKALSGTSPEFAKSDVMGSLKELSSRIRQSTARDKIVFLVSDMLENSGISSFYASKNVRAIEPAVELKKAQEAQAVGDFGGARVYVLGAGLVQENSGGRNKDSGIYRNPKTMATLRQFWGSYFEASHAKLVEFGSPALLSPVK
ncbi:MAG: hypothetical protein JJD98_03275 [Polaromonas sp.]|nr:hypothetical protein [Polaromonas sp.]